MRLRKKIKRKIVVDDKNINKITIRKLHKEDVILDITGENIALSEFPPKKIFLPVKFKFWKNLIINKKFLLRLLYLITLSKPNDKDTRLILRDLRHLVKKWRP